MTFNNFVKTAALDFSSQILSTNKMLRFVKTRFWCTSVSTKGHKLSVGHKLILLPNFDFETSDLDVHSHSIFYIGVSSVSF